MTVLQQAAERGAAPPQSPTVSSRHNPLTPPPPHFPRTVVRGYFEELSCCMLLEKFIFLWVATIFPVLLYGGIFESWVVVCCWKSLYIFFLSGNDFPVLLYGVFLSCCMLLEKFNYFRMATVLKFSFLRMATVLKFRYFRMATFFFFRVCLRGYF